MAAEKPNPTMKDVAQEAGVALGTVSKVVNGIPVGEEYRVRVEKAIKKLGYRVNVYARGLRSDRTHIIEVIVPNLIAPFFAKLVHYINRALIQRGYQMMLCATDNDIDLEQNHVFMAETCVNLVLTERSEKAPSLICLPVSYAYGGTTRQENQEAGS